MHGPLLERVDGVAPLRAYGCLGDGRTVALVARDGDIDWWPEPRLDDPPLVAALLDPGHGGRVTLAPNEPHTVERTYLEGTNVLCTVVTTAGGSARVTDALNTGEAGYLPWCELVRRVDGLEGSVRVVWSFEPGDRFGSAMGWSERSALGPVVHIGSQLVGVRTDADDEVELTLRGARGEVRTAVGSRAVVAFVACDDERPQVLRSALALKHAGRWAAERDEVRAWIDRHCWSEAQGSYTMAAGSEDLDASVLLMARMGFDRGQRLTGTAAAVSRELGAGPDNPLLYRYTGMDAEEGAFLACSFWMVGALVHLDRWEEGHDLFTALLPWSTDVGLFTEQADPDGTLLGNLPQALTHLSLVTAATVLRDRRPHRRRPGPG